MSFKGRSCLVLFALLLAFATLSLGAQDPELEQCKHQCRAQQQYGEKKIKACLQKCEDYVREKHSREERGEREREEIMYRERESMEKEEEKEEGQNPYVFEDRHFVTRLQTRYGRVRILPKFTDRSKLLRGIENYRVTILEADPQTFLVPNHWDAEAVIFVANGRGTVSIVRQDSRESFNIKQGDIFRVKAGTTTYLINSDNNERLILAKLLQPVSAPGQFEVFFGAGGENPESFFRAFSDELLEAAFNTRSDRIQRLFGQQKQGAIVKASQEQIKAMSHREEEGGIWPFGGERESKGTINLYQQRPTHSNQYGQLYEVDSRHYRQLQDLDIGVSLANITQGAMTAPQYSSKATKIALVVEGEGYFEMACPHLGRQQGSQRAQRETSAGPSYQKVSSRLTRGTVVVVPAGHPSIAVASNNQNLQLLCFEVNYRNNEKYPLAGRRNVMKQLEREAKELAFGMPAREVEEVFNSQQEEFFLKGPRQQRQGRADA